MATVEKSGAIKYKNSSGDTTIFYPNTLANNVSGLSDAISSTANSVIDTKLTDINAHLINKANPHEVTAEQIKALSSEPVSMASADGATYTCTTPGITELTAGVSFIGVPAIESTSTSVTLNVNNLGAKQLRRGVSTSSGTTTAGYNESWLAADKPLRIMYDGLFWIVDNARPYAADLMGTVPIANGGTGASDGATGLANLFAAGSTVLSSNQYGETLPTAGSAGRLFFKKGESIAKPVTMASTDGVTYTCTVPGITELTAGVSFIGIPEKVSTSKDVKLNVNGLGDKYLRRRSSRTSSTTVTGGAFYWLGVNKPLGIMYDGDNWIVTDMTQPSALDLYGSVPLANGGTGAVDGATGLANLFAAGSTVLSSNQYGDTLPDAGTAGRLFFKKGESSTAITTSNIGEQTVKKAKYATDDVSVETPALRNQYFSTAESTPTVNGQICWVYG